MNQKQTMKNLMRTVIALLILLGTLLMVLAVITLQKPKNGEVQVAVTPPVATPQPTPVVEKAELIMAGDALLHGAVYTDAKTAEGNYDFTEMMSTLNRVLDHYDLKYYNQETILGGTELGLSTYPCFNSPQEFGDTMMDLGFNLVSLANNHTLDRGEQAILNSLDYWSNQNARTAGSYSSFDDREELRVREINGIRYTLLSYTYGTNGIPVPEGKEYLVNVYTDEMLAEDIAKARGEVDVLMVAMHWGEEYTHEPTAEQRRLAQLLADLGVDIIIGSHPHVVQPIEWIDDTLCIYSLGNLISAQDGTFKRVGLLAGVTITKTTFEGQSHIQLSAPRADLVYTQYTPGYHHFKLKFFDEIEESELKDVWGVYDQYGKIVTDGGAVSQLGGL